MAKEHLAALLWDLSLVSSTHFGQLITACNSSFSGLLASLGTHTHVAYTCAEHSCVHMHTHTNTYLSKRELVFVLCPGATEGHLLCLLSSGSYSVLLPIALGLALLILTLCCSFEPSSSIICHFHQ